MNVVYVLTAPQLVVSVYLSSSMGFPIPQNRAILTLGQLITLESLLHAPVKGQIRVFHFKLKARNG